MSREDWGFEAPEEQEERAYRKEMDTLRWAGEAVQLPPLPRHPRTCVIVMTPREAALIRQDEQRDDEARADARYVHD